MYHRNVTTWIIAYFCRCFAYYSFRFPVVKRFFFVVCCLLFVVWLLLVVVFSWVSFTICLLLSEQWSEQWSTVTWEKQHDYQRSQTKNIEIFTWQESCAVIWGNFLDIVCKCFNEWVSEWMRERWIPHFVCDFSASWSSISFRQAGWSERVFKARIGTNTGETSGERARVTLFRRWFE